MANGSIYEVDTIDTIHTALWLGASEALIIDGCELIHLESGDDIVGVTRIR